MSKVSNKCVNCDSQFIVLIKDKGKDAAWPACWNCSFPSSEEEKKALHIDLNINCHLKDDDLFKEATEVWEEYMKLLKEEKKLEELGEN